MKLNKKCIVAIASFIMLMLQAFGLKFDMPVVNELISTGASILVMLGILSDSGATAKNDSPDQTDEDSEADSLEDTLPTTMENTDTSNNDSEES